jgi:hypothetical protein
VCLQADSNAVGGVTDRRTPVRDGGRTGPDPKELTMTWLLYNIPLMVLFFALWAGIPLWLVARHPDTGPQAAAQLSAIVYLPAQQDDPGYQRAA